MTANAHDLTHWRVQLMGWTQAQAADYFGRSRRWYQAREHGRAPIDPMLEQAAAAALYRLPGLPRDSG